MEELRRTKVNMFKIEDAIKLDDIKIKENLEKIIDIETIFKDRDKITLAENQIKPFLNGVKLNFTNKDRNL